VSFPWILNVRKLVAIDLSLHGPRLIIAEFAIGVLGCTVLGVLSVRVGMMLLPTEVSWQLLIGAELLFVAMNYVPLLLQALDLAGTPGEREHVAEEMRKHPALVRQYSVLQLWLMVPVAVVAFSIVQSWRRAAATP
jgi:hypothetical protein